MADFPFYYTIPVRYGDLDAQWHVNNAKFLTYLEQARLAYLMELGLFDGRSFLDLGLIVADIHIAYRRPLKLGQVARVGVRVERVGNKSLTLANEIQIGDTGEVAATAEVVLVAYDYRLDQSIPVPEDWRKRIEHYQQQDA
ncbi:MAG TPA: acyl-CoA thioesterase [Chloroflexi bacterium]|jgi:acyl-CoA thioester hydrolase|nr:acyl-CoA thioesterase [Chloroflexota bacterium]